MRYIARQNGYDRLEDADLLKKLLQLRGVEDVDKFIHLKEDCIKSAKSFLNIKEGLQLVDYYVVNDGNICIIMDSDCDGVASAAFTYSELKKINPKLNIEFCIHTGKQHGIVIEELKEQTSMKWELLIVPDAGSSDYIQCEELTKLNKKILILDHHIYDDERNNDNKSIEAIRINCQDGVYENNTLSGVGVCYKFFNLYEECLKYPRYSNDMLDIVALGIIGDSMNLKNHETRYLCLKGIDIMNDKDKGNKFIKEIIKKITPRVGEEMNIMKVSWNIAPLINGTIRVGKMEEKLDMVKAMAGFEEERIYQPRRKHKEDPKPEPIVQSLQEYMARIIGNCKSRQDGLVKKQFEKIQEKIKVNMLDKDTKIIIVDGTEEIDNNFTGYVANKIAGYYKRPALILNKTVYQGKDENDNIIVGDVKIDRGTLIYGGSGRNYSMFESDNLRRDLLSTKCFIDVAGHDNAFGIKLPIYNVQNVKDLLNKAYRDYSVEDVYHVDYSIPVGRLKTAHIKQIGQFENVWGCGLEAPLFAITDIWIDVNDMELKGEKQNVLVIQKTIGSTTIKFKSMMKAKEFYYKILGIEENAKGLVKKKTSGRIGLEIIGKFTINHFAGKEFPEIEIVDLNVLKQKREIKF